MRVNECAATLRHLEQIGKTHQGMSVEELIAFRNDIKSTCDAMQNERCPIGLRNRAQILRLSVERHIGRRLTKLRLRGGDRIHGRPGPSLNSLGISKNQSKRWQAMGRLSDGSVRRYVEESLAAGDVISVAGLLRSVSSKLPKNRKPDADSEGSEDAALIEELSQHCHLLQDILRPVYEERSCSLETGEYRAIGYLLSEFGAIVEELSEHLAIKTSNSRERD